MLRDSKSKPQSSDSNQNSPGDNCERCSQENDDSQIFVSVSPKVIILQKDNPRESKLVIRNNNAFPVFFKTCSTNKSAFVPHPVTGRISPYNEV